MSLKVSLNFKIGRKERYLCANSSSSLGSREASSHAKEELWKACRKDLGQLTRKRGTINSVVRKLNKRVKSLRTLEKRQKPNFREA